MLILVIKNWKMRKMLKAQLEEEGFEVLDFESTDNAFDIKGRDVLAPEKSSLIVIDLTDNGYTIDKLREIKKRAGGTHVILLRGAAGILDSELKKEGFNFILKRPFTIGQLVKEVTNVLDKSFR
jgi:DNA-binding NtrC family response regulator